MADYDYIIVGAGSAGGALAARLSEDPKNFPVLIEAYKTATEGKSQTLKPGDEIALKQSKGGLPLKLLCVCGAGDVLPDKPDAPENAVAKEHKPKAEDK